MKARRVILTLEVETDAPLSTLKNAGMYASIAVVDHWAKVLQAQANVIVEKKDTKIRRR